MGDHLDDFPRRAWILLLVIALLSFPACEPPETQEPAARATIDPQMKHRANLHKLMPRLCAMLAELERGDRRVYETYSMKIRDSLHSLMDDYQERDAAKARALIRAENLLEITLLGHESSGRKADVTRQVIDLTRAPLKARNHVSRCSR